MPICRKQFDEEDGNQNREVTAEDKAGKKSEEVAYDGAG